MHGTFRQEIRNAWIRRYYNLKFDGRLGSDFQSDYKSLNRISRLLHFTRSCGKTSYRLVNRGPVFLLAMLSASILSIGLYIVANKFVYFIYQCKSCFIIAWILLLLLWCLCFRYNGIIVHSFWSVFISIDIHLIRIDRYEKTNRNNSLCAKLNSWL